MRYEVSRCVPDARLRFVMCHAAPAVSARRVATRADFIARPESGLIINERRAGIFTHAR